MTTATPAPNNSTTTASTVAEPPAPTFPWGAVDAIGSLASAIAAWFLILRGFDVWRKQLRKARQRDVAEQLLVQAITAASALEAARQPCVLADDTLASNYEEVAKIVLDRLNAASAKFDALRATSDIAAVNLGETISASVAPILDAPEKIRTAARMLIGPAREVNRDVNISIVESDRTDFFSAELATALANLKTRLAPYLSITD